MYLVSLPRMKDGIMEKTLIMINGLPGNMASEVAKAAADAPDMEIVPFSLTGPEIEAKNHAAAGVSFTLVRPEERDALAGTLAERFPGLICIDFTHPSAVNANADYYCIHGFPFVMGTTGGDREALFAAVERSGVPAVIAPNMAKQIVGLQLMLKYAAENFPGLFKGYSLRVVESHQQGKADTSGTAKAMVSYFNGLGVPFEVDQIEKVRDPEVQRREWNIPEEYLGGHAYHTYTLTSPDGTVDFQFKHNVRGRKVYAAGTLDAVRFLKKKVEEGAGGVFEMFDVLRAGDLG